MAVTNGGCGRDELNKAIKMPDKLLTDDGRIISIKMWKPKVEWHNIVEVEIRGTVFLEEKMPVFYGFSEREAKLSGKA